MNSSVVGLVIPHDPKIVSLQGKFPIDVAYICR